MIRYSTSHAVGVCTESAAATGSTVMVRLSPGLCGGLTYTAVAVAKGVSEADISAVREADAAAALGANATCLHCGGPAYVGLLESTCLRSGGCQAKGSP